MDLIRLQACPRGTVGVSGVDLQPLDGVEGGDAAPTRFSCVGVELPMLMRKDGAARVHEVRFFQLILRRGGRLCVLSCPSVPQMNGARRYAILLLLRRVR